MSLAILSAQGAFADAIVRTQAMRATNIAEYFVTEQGVRVELELGISELEAFANLLPDALFERLKGQSIPLDERLGSFFSRDLPVLVDGGEALKGYVVEIGPGERLLRDDVTGEPIADESLEPETVILATLSYPFEAPPESITFVNATGASIGFVAYHEGVAVNDFRYLTPAQTLKLDWQDPWYSAFESRALRRTYFAPMSVFVYVEPYEVRKEIIVRPKDLQQWLDLELAGRESIPIEMQPELKRQVAEFLKGRHATTIDGEPASGELARINFLERTLTTSNVIDPPRELDVNVATLGVIFVYPTVEPLPQNVQVQWDMFSDKMQIVPGASVDQAGSLPVYLEPDYAVLEWQNFLRFPELPTLKVVQSPPGSLAATLAELTWMLLAVAGLIIAAIWWSARQAPKKALVGTLVVVAVAAVAFGYGYRARLTQDGVETLVADLLHNVYRAFDFRAEGEIYDVLAQSVSGDLLTRVYLETRRGLVLESQGGARAKVKDIELTSVNTRPSVEGGFIAEVAWVVSGSVGHWGHLHQRRNAYQAELDIRPLDGAWKLVGMDVLNEERL